MCRLCLREHEVQNYFIASRTIDGVTEYAAAIELSFFGFRRKIHLGTDFCTFYHRSYVLPCGSGITEPINPHWDKDRKVIQDLIDNTIYLIETRIMHVRDKEELEEKRKSASIEYTKYP